MPQTVAELCVAQNVSFEQLVECLEFRRAACEGDSAAAGPPVPPNGRRLPTCSTCPSTRLCGDTRHRSSISTATALAENHRGDAETRRRAVKEDL